MPFISFIVPVYNIKKFIPLCIESIVQQPYEDWEIILIDDNSNDGSGEICDWYASQDSRIFTIHLSSNKGPGVARNEGIIRAIGNYVFFLDGDDAIESDALPLLVKAIKKSNFPELMYVEFSAWFGNTQINRIVENDESEILVLSPDDFLRPHVNNRQMGFCVWQFIMRRDVLNDLGISFREAWVGEDIDFTLRTFFASKTIGVFGKSFYQYRTRLTGSLSLTSGHIKRWDQLIKSASGLFDLVYNDLLTDLQKQWVIKNIYFFLIQFEEITGALSEEDVNNHKELFLPFEQNLIVLKEYISENNLLKYIQIYGAIKGIKAFWLNKTEELKIMLDGKILLDLFLFPATRKSSLLAGLLNANGYIIKGMLDNDTKKQGLMIDGQVILKPEVILHCYDDINKLFVIISTATRNTTAILANQLSSYGLKEGKHFISVGCDEK